MKQRQPDSKIITDSSNIYSGGMGMLGWNVGSLQIVKIQLCSSLVENGARLCLGTYTLQCTGIQCTHLRYGHCQVI